MPILRDSQVRQATPLDTTTAPITTGEIPTHPPKFHGSAACRDSRGVKREWRTGRLRPSARSIKDLRPGETAPEAPKTEFFDRIKRGTFRLRMRCLLHP
jgi:hypothetical protein